MVNRAKISWLYGAFEPLRSWWRFKRWLWKLDSEERALLEFSCEREEERSRQLLDLQIQRRQIEDSLLLKKARTYRIPTPPRPNSADFGHTGPSNAFWEPASTSTPFLQLTDKGINHLREEIRREQKERRERVLSWVFPVLAMLTGILGALTGLLAVLSK